MRFSVVVGQGRPGSSWRFQPLLWQIPAEFCAFLWRRILLIADLDSLDPLQGGAIVYFAPRFLGVASQETRDVSANIGMDRITLNNGHLMLSTQVPFVIAGETNPTLLVKA
jgi:hypothetical protein